MNRTATPRRWPLVLLALVFVFCAAAAHAANPKDELYVFGDSLSDNGNLHALAEAIAGINYPPSPPYAQNNSNGPTWVAYFQEALGIPVHNLAVGGSFSGPIEVPVGGGATVSFSNFNSFPRPDALPIPGLPGVQEQVAGLIADHPEGLNPEALYVIWAGANDLFVAFSVPALAETVIGAIPGNIVGAMCALNAAGARHFAVGNVTNIGLTPFAQMGDPATVTFVIEQLVNPGIEQALAIVGPACSESILLLDTFEDLNEVAANPESFGLTNVTDPCLLAVPPPWAECGGYLFWDGVHPTTAASALFADFFRADFCGTGAEHPGLRGKPATQPPPIWRGACYGAR